MTFSFPSRQPPSHPTRLAAALALMLVCGASAWSKTPPDAGRVLKQTTPPLEAPRPSTGPRIESPALSTAAPGGTQAPVRSVEITGNTVFTDAQLSPALGEVTGRSFDLAGLRELANRLSVFYRQAGYPFARAYIPAQALNNGVLRIDVVEGRYGNVSTQGNATDVARTMPFLHNLQQGQVIESAPLERASLLLGDLPGVRVTPLVRPGQATGTGDLVVQVDRKQHLQGEVGVDNHGNRYTGQERVHANLDINSPFLLGDQVLLRSMVTAHRMWFGSAGYSLPLGGSGLRGQFSIAHTYYRLAEEFASLDGTGTADVASIGLSYPVLRSQALNLSFSAQATHKRLHDEQGAAGTSSRKSSDTLPLALNFDARDGLGGGGVTYGVATFTTGRLHLDDALATTDATTARSRGSFTKLNLDVARMQSLGGAFSVYAHVAAQWADKNLDSSESFGLGGAHGVRAYPEGEAYGDRGVLGQFELRYAAAGFSPYAFYDAGHVTTKVTPWSKGSNTRSIAGAGLGVRGEHGPWSFDATLATRTHGGRPQSDSRNFNPAAWLSASYRF